MFATSKLYLILVLVTLVSAAVWAQTPTAESARAQQPEVNIIINQNTVKFAAPAELAAPTCEFSLTPHFFYRRLNLKRRAGAWP